MDHISQEISAVSRKLEDMDSAMVELTAETRSMGLDIRHLDVKFGLFEPARMWITKNGESLNFYDLEDLRTFLERLHDQAQSMEMTAQTPQDIRGLPSGAGHPATTSEPEGKFTIDPQTRGRDLQHPLCACDGPTLPRSDPSYPWGSNTIGIPDPDVLRSGTNQQALPGDSRQQQPLRAITRIEKEDGGDFEGGEE
ncbi:hypothetical protein NDU88_005677 [Pleurodeles waltl]|uniref:Uncharacterized protein n=1 Tax=Pleurodeles waltl TaxID=8319 RepID=A0AAV7SML7_PLEWA|nr:hypothetical protein NDU88_005677 [Pleurodeles waltl]